MNKALYTFVCRFLCGHVIFNSFGQIPMSMIIGLHGKSKALLKNCQTVFRSGPTFVHSHQQWKKVPVASLSAAGVVSVLDFGHSNRCVVVFRFLTCISLMTCDVKHLLIYLPFLYLCSNLLTICAVCFSITEFSGCFLYSG